MKTVINIVLAACVIGFDIRLLRQYHGTDQLR